MQAPELTAEEYAAFMEASAASGNEGNAAPDDFQDATENGLKQSDLLTR